MDILSALKKLIEKLGGNSHASDIAEAVLDIPGFPESELPELPSDTGIYILTCTVTEEATTLSWEVAE